MNCWDEDDRPIRENSHKVGRPEVNPFPSDEVEKDFVVRGHKMIELYWNDEPNTKTNFQFSPSKRMSKTCFWTMIYIYHMDQKGLRENHQGFIAAINKHFGLQYSTDNRDLGRKMKEFNENIYITHHLVSSNTKTANKQEKYRSQYRYIIRKWEECLG